MKCKTHKKYKGRLRPIDDCIECWEIFLCETASYNDVCKEMMGFQGNSLIFQMLKDYKDRFDKDWALVGKALADDVKAGYFNNSYSSLKWNI